ncbi:arginine--tRNA ligase, cytoplasmic-like [Macrosteles quadrilineatus]|uniref:arginine--tRNA ligase, cytoplasmic-like n=1 Tax=Macrosteles quadrilineatus TaxID=74068 RepID=UPI0023E2356B|nr:arginine--tRNA ligase, cytoplasmic-like [Macrosteles quadrilineatus]
MDIENIKRRTDKAEDEVKLLTELFNKLKSSVSNGNGAEVCMENASDEFTDLITLNTKLKHRLAILKRALLEEKEKSAGDTMENILDSLSQLFISAVARAYPDIPDPPVPLTTSSAPQFGDYQCNAAMPITQLLKAQGIKVSPRDVATRIKENLDNSGLIEKIEIAGPGFLNVWISRKHCQSLLTKILTKGVLPPPQPRKLKIVIDFSSPNIAKEMHVGHLRSTIIGESIARLLEYLGHDVERVNHIGDWGTQFGMLIAHLQDKYPNYKTESPPLSTLMHFYKEAKVRFDTDEVFKKRAYESVVKLQAGDPEYTQAWQLICDVSRKENQMVYDRLGVRLTERGESFYQSRMEVLVKELKERGLLEEDDKRFIMWGKNKDLIPFTIVKSDGGFTYDTSDMATIRYRIEESKADWIIYVVDMGQATHFVVLNSCAEKAGWLNPSKVRVDFVGFGVVLGEDKKKFKTRSGESVRLVELLDEGLKKALDTLKAKGRDQVLSATELQEAQEAVAYGCIKYADLSHNRVNDYVFSFDKMLEDKGNTAVYLLYAYTRICSIARNANITVSELEQAANTIPVAITHEKEWKLAKVLLRFPEVLTKITRELYVHTLCEYLYEIACTFTEFYDCCYCIEKDTNTGEVKKVHMDRLLLTEATARVMKQCFNILGLNTVSRM